MISSKKDYLEKSTSPSKNQFDQIYNQTDQTLTLLLSRYKKPQTITNIVPSPRQSPIQPFKVSNFTNDQQHLTKQQQKFEKMNKNTLSRYQTYTDQEEKNKIKYVQSGYLVQKNQDYNQQKDQYYLKNNKLQGSRINYSKIIPHLKTMQKLFYNYKQTHLNCLLQLQEQFNTQLENQLKNSQIVTNKQKIQFQVRKLREKQQEILIQLKKYITNTEEMAQYIQELQKQYHRDRERIIELEKRLEKKEVQWVKLLNNKDDQIKGLTKQIQFRSQRINQFNRLQRQNESLLKSLQQFRGIKQYYDKQKALNKSLIQQANSYKNEVHSMKKKFETIQKENQILRQEKNKIQHNYQRQVKEFENRIIYSQKAEKQAKQMMVRNKNTIQNLQLTRRKQNQQKDEKINKLQNHLNMALRQKDEIRNQYQKSTVNIQKTLIKYKQNQDNYIKQQNKSNKQIKNLSQQLNSKLKEFQFLMKQKQMENEKLNNTLKQLDQKFKINKSQLEEKQIQKKQYMLKLKHLRDQTQQLNNQFQIKQQQLVQQLNQKNSQIQQLNELIKKIKSKNEHDFQQLQNKINNNQQTIANHKKKILAIQKQKSKLYQQTYNYEQQIVSLKKNNSYYMTQRSNLLEQLSKLTQQFIKAEQQLKSSAVHNTQNLITLENLHKTYMNGIFTKLSNNEVELQSSIQDIVQKINALLQEK